MLETQSVGIWSLRIQSLEIQSPCSSGGSAGTLTSADIDSSVSSRGATSPLGVPVDNAAVERRVGELEHPPEVLNRVTISSETRQGSYAACLSLNYSQD
jgi:hypothetical protein